RPYVGLGISTVHHTGHDRDTSLDVQSWVLGGKALAGVEVTRHLSVEVAYHYLNSAPLRPTIHPWSEHSYAVAGSLLLYSVPVLWPFPTVAIRCFARAGAAYKLITDDNIFNSGIQVEDGVRFLVGGGFEVD